MFERILTFRITFQVCPFSKVALWGPVSCAWISGTCFSHGIEGLDFPLNG